MGLDIFGIMGLLKKLQYLPPGAFRLGGFSKDAQWSSLTVQIRTENLAVLEEALAGAGLSLPSPVDLAPPVEGLTRPPESPPASPAPPYPSLDPPNQP